MKYFIPTYEQCRAICDANDNFIFYETKHVIDGYNVSIFNYRLAQPKDFTLEIIELKEKDKYFKLNGNEIFNGKPFSEYSDDELQNIGFEKLSEFKI